MNIVSATVVATILTFGFIFGIGISWVNRPYGKENYVWAWWAVWLWFGTATIVSWYIVSRLT